jgi:hypothetical protein
MTNPRLDAFFVIARGFFATKQPGFGHRCNYNRLLAYFGQYCRDIVFYPQLATRNFVLNS